jgi:hypothetical protein
MKNCIYSINIFFLKETNFIDIHQVQVELGKLQWVQKPEKYTSHLEKSGLQHLRTKTKTRSRSSHARTVRKCKTITYGRNYSPAKTQTRIPAPFIVKTYRDFMSTQPPSPR